MSGSRHFFVHLSIDETHYEVYQDTHPRGLTNYENTSKLPKTYRNGSEIKGCLHLKGSKDMANFTNTGASGAQHPKELHVCSFCLSSVNRLCAHQEQLCSSMQYALVKNCQEWCIRTRPAPPPSPVIMINGVLGQDLPRHLPQ